MAKTSAPSRVLRLSLASALLWTAPGLQAPAAAAAIIRALPSASSDASASVAAPLAAAAPSVFLETPSALAFAAAPSPAAAAAPDAASAPIDPVAAAAAPADSERPSAIDSARPAAPPALNAERPSRLARMFDGALSGARRAAANVLPAADGPDFELPAPARGRARVSVAFASRDAEAGAATLRRLEQVYDFKPERPPVDGPGEIAVNGTVPTSTLLAMANANDLLKLQVTSGAPGPTGNSGLKAAAVSLMKAVTPAPAREPFVAATRRVAELEALAKSDPDKAYALSTEYITGRRETRREVRIAALRALDAMPLAKVLPFYQKILAAYSDQRVQNAKAAGSDSVWYIQRAVLRRLAREAEALKSSEPVASIVRTHYADRNASVRLAAAAVLRAMGVEPGPENEYLDPAAAAPLLSSVDVPEVDATRDAPPAASKKPVKNSFWRRWKFALIGLVAAAMIGIVSLECRDAFFSPAPTPATEVTAAAPDSARVQAPLTEQQLLQKIAQSQERLAKAQEDQVAAQKAAAGGGIFSGILPMIASSMVFLGIFMLFNRFSKGAAGGGGPSSGAMTASTATSPVVDKPSQRFSDIEGIDESLVDVQETLDYLRDPARFVRMGAKAPKGILFEGPPGTGKTLMARALAGETDSAFFSVSGSDFVELFVGMGAKRVRELIATAANHKPAIVFIDEIDAVGKARGGRTQSDSEREQTLNALLTGMDGFDNSGGIVFVAATNRADTLDPALLRPGRFDRKIYVGKPHMGGREAIATIHAKDKRLAPELDLAYVARRTAGLAGADIQNIMNEAALQAIRRGADAIGMEDVDEAIDRGTIGAKRSLPMPDALKRRVAYHEAGHVLSNMLNENVEVRQKVNKFTIVPHGSGALGFAEMGSEEGDKYLYTLEELEARIDHALGGLVAEKLIFGRTQDVPEEYATNRRADWSTGPGSDLEVATNVARTMVQTLGMGLETGFAVTAPDRRDPMGRAPFGDAVAERTWVEVNKILEASYQRVTARLTRNRHVLEALAQAVLKKETLIDNEIEDVVREAGPVPPPARAPQNK